MAFCTNCGKQIAEDAKFCPFCGTAVEAPAAPAVQETPAVPETPVVPPPAPQEIPQVPVVPEAPAAPASVPQEIPPQPQYAAPPQPQYAAPQQPQYAAPPQPQYAAPQQPQYAAPQQPQYAAPQQPQYAAAPGGYYPPQYPPVGAVPAKKGGALKIILPIVAVLAVAAVVLIFVLGGGGYEKAVDRAFEIEQGNFSELEKALPDSVWEAQAEERGYDSVKEYLQFIKDMFEEYGDEDSNVRYSYSTEEDNALSKEDLEELKEGLHDRYDAISADSVTDARWLKLKVILTDEEGTDEETVYMGVVEIDGDWYALSANSDGTVRARFLFD